MSDIIVIIMRTIVLYALILVVFRVMGKREIGELSILDLVVFIMMGEMAVVAIEQHDDPLWHTIIPILLLMSIQVSLAFISLKSQKARNLLDGKPSIIITKGKIDEKEMRKHRYNFDDLLTQLRQQGVHNIADVEFAVLETSGELSVFQNNSNKKINSLTIPLIVDGSIQTVSLGKINKSEEWLRSGLIKGGHPDIERISFCSYQDGKFFVDYMDEQPYKGEKG